MLVISAQAIDEALDFPSLIEVLRSAFASPIVQPVRHHHRLDWSGGCANTMLLMPAWGVVGTRNGGSAAYAGVKVVTVAPQNAVAGNPTVVGLYSLLNGRTGEPLAVIDGHKLTLWRTAAASGLAACYLARPDAKRLLIVGAGSLSTFLASAHASIRPIAEIRVWNRTEERGRNTVEALRSAGYAAELARNLDEAVGWADIISACTMSTEPLIRGSKLRPGAHVDLVGSYSPVMRECDDESMLRASVYVDTRAGALEEAGDIVQPVRRGVIGPEHIRGELSDLTRNKAAGRRAQDEITLFKSVGAALEDLAAAVFIFERLSSGAAAREPSARPT